MRAFTEEFARTLHDLRTLEEIGVKTASAEITYLTAHGVQRGASDLYDVLVKKAEDEFPGETHERQVDVTVVKMAMLLGKPVPSPILRAKIAAAVAIDELLTSFLRTEPAENRAKLAETRAYGREFVTELLRKAI